jgi:hypothetical protein
METPGTLKPIFPDVERLLGAAKPVADVLAELDRQRKAEGTSGVDFLPLSEPITPHLDQILGPLPKADEK